MIRIKFIEADLMRFMRALDKLAARVKLWGEDEMQRRCAIDYYQLVAKNIRERSYANPQYRERYAEWKKKYGRMGYPAPWKLFGDLLRSLQTFKVKDGWVGGIPAGLMDSGGKSWLGQGDYGDPKEIAMYGAVEESRRPIFKPTATEYANVGWRKRGQEALEVFRRTWV